MADAYRDGVELLRARLDELSWQRDALLAKRLEDDCELAVVEREIEATHAKLGLSERAKPWSWHWLLTVPVAALGLSAIAFLCLSGPGHGRRFAAAQRGAEVIKQAAELYRNIEETTGCPTVEDLVTAKKLDAKKADDPWGLPYHIECDGEDVHARSAGKDGRFFTPDDIRDDFKPRDIERVANLD